MFGTYRLLLALMVLLKHFKSTEVFSAMAVWAFFLVSGFLITGILNGRYADNRQGRLEFALNRALRVLPTYWVSVVVASVLVVVLGRVLDPRLVNDALALPVTALEWFSAIFILGGTLLGVGRVENSPSPSVWAVEVEILMYALSVLWVSRSAAAARNTFLACLMLYPALWLAAKWLIGVGHPTLAGSLIYSFLPAALLPYAAGSWLWHARHSIRPPAHPVALALACGAALAICGLLVVRASVTLALLLSLPFFAVMTFALSNLRRPAARGVDDFLGHMSYPVYLMHWVGNYLVLSVARLCGAEGHVAHPVGALLGTTVLGFVAVVATTLLLAAAVAIFVERPIESRRRGLARRWSNALASSGPAGQPDR